MTDVEAVAGGKAKLPCDVEPPISGDKLHLVIWYKDESDTPIYSFDTRGRSTLDQGKHWQNFSLDGRASFLHSEEPAKLVLDNVRETDAAIYRCRVDFKHSPTRNSKVNFTVIIPPEQLSILDEDGSHIPHYILGPYSEGASLNITCVAAGGRPPPRVTWWQENALLDDTYENIGSKKVRNVLRLEKLNRKHLHTILTCQASNNNMVAPISSSVTLNMNLKPLWVRMQGENRAFSAGTTYEIGCEVVGARPTPKITWSKGSITLRNARLTVSPVGNTTTSMLTFVPSIEDAGKYLSCKASVPDIPDSEMETGWKLDIYHEPVVTLELGSNLNSSAIREGIDVYFECNIKSNPWVYKVSWRHNGNPLYHNTATGTIISNQSLVLQSVTRSRAGIYTCIGSNQEGDGESNPLNLDIKYAPVCHSGQTKVFGVARQETTKIPCELEANPAEVSFTWKFNNTMEAVDIAQAHVTSVGTHSTASYTPMTELDYGTLLCWGSNDQGTQLEPCVYHIVPAGERLARPPSPENCTIKEESRTTVKVSCAESEYFDENTATYVLQVFDADTRHLLGSATSLTPRMLEVTDLPMERSHAGLVLSLRVMTAHATSDATVLHSPNFIQEGKTQEHQRYPALTPVMLSLSGPLLGAVVGATAGLLLVIFVIVLAVRLRYRPRPQEDKDSHDDGGMANLAASGGTAASSPRDKSSVLPLSADSIESFEKDPDIISHTNESSYAEMCKGTSPRYVIQPKRTDASTFTNNFSLCQASELTYAELSLRNNRRIPPNCYQSVQMSTLQRPQILPMSTVIRRQAMQQEPTIYTQVAGHSKSIYVPPPHAYMNLGGDESTVETPLIGHDNKITTISQSGSSLWRNETPPPINAPTT
ncbi:PREDICTED: synaptogenesis protein syg-2-like isoform X6 [Polistes dominula]|uniref:Synaptogenesis protein syg-2-like isoform X6 n=1 Tax=Polistes dominula TaxID=743375 RepID=A0ABM1HYG6_POLDO|nr:PREDICTED: synaptogenesis protein syg-2-like isoform X6 [Polistes dominula]